MDRINGMSKLEEGKKYYINESKEVFTYVGVDYEFTDSPPVFLTPIGLEVQVAFRDIHTIEETTSPTSGMKFDAGEDKLKWHLVPTSFNEVVKVLTMGSKKYSDNNWKFVDPGYDRYYSAAKRHMEDFRKAIEEGTPRQDKDMKTHLLANAICDLIFLMDQDMHGWPNQKNPPTKTTWRNNEKTKD